MSSDKGTADQHSSLPADAAIRSVKEAATASGQDATQVQHPSDVADSKLRSKGPCQAPGYKILKPLGAGTYGEVWLAEDERTHVPVAIKFFVHGASRNWQSLQAEVQQLCQLHADPGIIQLIDVETASMPPYYVMDYAQGGSLAKRLEKGPLPFAEALKIFRQVAEALAYVHAKGIRHCDLKPANVLLDVRGRVRLADFGQAHLSSDASPALGTFFYMAPEQANLASQIPDTRWDVFGLGALMYAMLTGRPPRQDPTLRSELAGTAELSHRLQRYRDSVQHAPKPTAHRRVKGIDRATADIIDGCLEINPDRRLRDAGAVLAALDRRERKRRQRPVFIFGLIAPVLLFFVTAGLISLVFSAAKTNAYLAQDKMQKKILERNKFIAELVADDIQESLEKCIWSVEGLAKQPALRQALKYLDAVTLADLLKKQLQGHTKDDPHILWVAAHTGEILAIAPYVKVLKMNYQWRDWFNGRGDQEEHARADPIQKTYISQPYESKAEGRPLLIAISTPVFDPDDDQQVVGVLAASMRVQLLEKWTARLDLDNHIAVILNDQGQYLSHEVKDAIKPTAGKKPRTVSTESVLHTQVLRDPDAGIIDIPFTDPINGKEYCASYAPLKRREVGWDTGWVVLIQQEYHVTWPAIEQLNRSMFAISLIAALVMAVLIPALWGWLIWMLRREERVAHG